MKQSTTPLPQQTPRVCPDAEAPFESENLTVPPAVAFHPLNTREPVNTWAAYTTCTTHNVMEHLRTEAA